MPARAGIIDLVIIDSMCVVSIIALFSINGGASVSFGENAAVVLEGYARHQRHYFGRHLCWWSLSYEAMPFIILYSSSCKHTGKHGLTLIITNGHISGVSSFCWPVSET